MTPTSNIDTWPSPSPVASRFPSRLKDTDSGGELPVLKLPAGMSDPPPITNIVTVLAPGFATATIGPAGSNATAWEPAPVLNGDPDTAVNPPFGATE